MSDNTVPRNRSRQIGFFMAAVLLYWFSQYVYLPLLPEYIRERTGDLAVVGVVLSMYGLWQMVARLPMGIAVDALGRYKPFVGAGFLLGAAGAVILGFAGRVPALIVGRSLTGICAGVWVPLVVAFSALFPPEEAVWASSMLTLVSSLGRILGSLSTGLLAELGGPLLPFLAAAAVSLVALLLLFPVRTEARSARPASLRVMLRVALRRDVIGPSFLAAGVQYVTFGIALGFLPILARQMGAGAVIVGVLVSLNLGGLSLGNLAATWLSRRVGPVWLLATSFLLLTLCTGGLALARSIGPLFLCQAVLGLAHGLGIPVLMGLSIRRVDRAERNTAMGLHQSVYAIGIFIGPWISGALAESLGLRSMFGITALFCLAAGVGGVMLLSGKTEAD
jgi:MFS family permease